MSGTQSQLNKSDIDKTVTLFNNYESNPDVKMILEKNSDQVPEPDWIKISSLKELEEEMNKILSRFGNKDTKKNELDIEQLLNEISGTKPTDGATSQSVNSGLQLPFGNRSSTATRPSSPAPRTRPSSPAPGARPQGLQRSNSATKYQFIGGAIDLAYIREMLKDIYDIEVTNYTLLIQLFSIMFNLKASKNLHLVTKLTLKTNLIKLGERRQTRFGLVNGYKPVNDDDLKAYAVSEYLNNNLDLANEEIMKKSEKFNDRHSKNTDLFTKVSTADKKPEIFVLTGGNLSSLNGEFEAMRNTYDAEKETLEEMMEGGAYGVTTEWAPMFDLKSVEKADKFHQMFMKLKQELENHGKALMESDETAISAAIQSLAEKEREASVLLQYLEKYVRLVRENEGVADDKEKMETVVNKYYKTLKKIDKKSSKIFGVMGGLVSAVLPIVG